MEFARKKYALVTIKKRRQKNNRRDWTSQWASIKKLGENESFIYLEILEAYIILQTDMEKKKEELLKN